MLPILPESLIELKLSYYYNYPLADLPYKLKKLFLGNNFNHSLDYLPQNLLELYIDNGYNIPLINLPNTLKVLYIGLDYNQTLDVLPDSIEILKIANDKLEINKLPSKIQKIIVNKSYKYIDKLLMLKPNLIIIDFDGYILYL